MSVHSNLDAMMSEGIDNELYTVAVETRKTQNGFTARLVTGAVKCNGETEYYADDGCNFGYMFRPTRRAAIRALKEHLEGFPCDFNIVPKKKLHVYDLDSGKEYTP